MHRSDFTKDQETVETEMKANGQQLESKWYQNIYWKHELFLNVIFLYNQTAWSHEMGLNISIG